jgi:hypothetical protein
VTGRCPVLQAACVYSLIRPLRIGPEYQQLGAARHEGYLKSRDHRQLMTSGGYCNTAAKNQGIIVAVHAILVIIRYVLVTGTPTTNSTSATSTAAGPE